MIGEHEETREYKILQVTDYDLLDEAMDRHEWYVDDSTWTGKVPGCEVNEAYRTDDLNGLSVVEAENGFYVIQDIEWQIQQGQLSQEWRRLIEVSGAYDEFTS